MNEKQFLAKVPWGKLKSPEGPALRFFSDTEFYDVCPIDAAGGKWGALGGKLGLDKTLHHAIVSAADIPLDRLYENYQHYFGAQQKAKYRLPLAGIYQGNAEQMALAMKLRILFRARISEAKG